MESELPNVVGWEFEVAEVSASTWLVVGHDRYGNQVRCLGDLQQCIRRCADEARAYPSGTKIKRMIL